MQILSRILPFAFATLVALLYFFRLHKGNAETPLSLRVSISIFVALLSLTVFLLLQSNKMLIGLALNLAVLGFMAWLPYFLRHREANRSNRG
jgi:multisubunit Na+/H+ antiporter MnhF subunit